jgi:hypothetical protein
LHFSVPVVLLYSSGLGWRVVTGKASWIGNLDIKLVLKGANIK